MNYKILTFLAAAVGSVAGLTFSTYLWTIRTWAPPEQPVLYLGIAMLLLFALCAVLWVQVTRTELSTGESSEEGVSAQTLGLKRLVALASVVVIGAIGLGAAGLWLSPEFRARVVPYAAENRIQLEAALADPSDLVRQRACLELIALGVARSEQSLAAALHDSPETAVNCLEEANGLGYNGTGAIARRLGSAWEAQLLGSSAKEADASCRIAASLPKIAALGKGHPHVSLLTCSLAAEALTVRTCCAQQLAHDGGTLAQTLGPPEDFPADEGEAIFHSFVDHTFRPLSLPLEQQDVASAMKSDDEANRRWAVEFGCSLIPDPDRRRSVVEGMLPIIEGGTCKLDEAAQYAFLETTQWIYLCDDILIAKDLPTEQAICQSFTLSLVERSVAEASSRVQSASRARFLASAADELERPLPPARAGGGANRKLTAHDRVYDVVGIGKTTIGSAPPPGSMCRKVTTVRNPAWQLGQGGTPYTERHTVVPCSTMSERDAGLTPTEAFRQRMLRAAAAARGDFDKALTKEQRKDAEAKVGRSMFNKGLSKASDGYKQGLKEAK